MITGILRVFGLKLHELTPDQMARAEKYVRETEAERVREQEWAPERLLQECLKEASLPADVSQVIGKRYMLDAHLNRRYVIVGEIVGVTVRGAYGLELETSNELLHPKDHTLHWYNYDKQWKIFYASENRVINFCLL